MMELHPFMERDTSPNDGLWYVLSAFGDCPSVRVGHTCTYIPGPDGTNGKVLVIGGANPSGPFAETYVLDLETFSWDMVESPGLRARYEHAAFVPKSQPTKVFVYGGADQGGNHSDMQVFDVELKKWSTLQARGSAPTPRTYHNHLCLEDDFIVYSGGHTGSDPVGDRQVHVYNAVTNTWTTLNVRGDPPKPRHGHLVVATETRKVIVHGGMSGTHFYEDLHVLDLEKKTWSSVKQKKTFPCARAAHGGVVTGGALYVFGGMNRDGALDDTWRLSLDTMKWARVEFEGPPPACRLDFGACAVRLKVPLHSAQTAEDIVGTGVQAGQVIGTQLRMNSGGSLRSLGSAGSHRSGVSLGSAGSIVDATPADLPSSPPQLSPQRSQHSSRNSSRHSSRHSSTNDLGASVAMDNINDAPFCGNSLPPGPTKTVEMLLVVGGMDTEGEIFDDTLVYLIKDFGPDKEPEEEEGITPCSERVNNLGSEGVKDSKMAPNGLVGDLECSGDAKTS